MLMKKQFSKIENLKFRGDIHAKGIDPATGKILWEDVRKNVVCLSGLNLIAQNLAGINSVGRDNFLKITHCAVGTGTATATTNDTKLQTEVYRNVPTHSNSGNQVSLTCYFDQTEPTGTWTEFGVFIQGTATADSGYIFNHLSGLNWVKTGTTEIQVDVVFTLASA